MQNLSLAVTEASQSGEARRLAATLADRLGLDETTRGKLAIIVSEAAKNLVKHATGGEMLLRALTSDGRVGVEILALDRGPGITNVAQALRDGHSTAGSAGTGLGAIARLADYFDIHSVAGCGTALLAQVWFKPGPPNPGSVCWSTGAICVPKPGEQVSGDGWVMAHAPNHSLLAVVDGLGHGLLAGEAAKEAVRIMRQNVARTPAEIIAAAHAALGVTRGAALAVAEIQGQRHSGPDASFEVRFAGVGNIAGVILAPECRRSMVSHHGIVGHNLRKVQMFQYSLPVNALLIMHSDGLKSSWSLERYPGLFGRHPSLIAGVLYRDFTRQSDDVTVVVAKAARGRGDSKKGSEHGHNHSHHRDAHRA